MKTISVFTKQGRVDFEVKDSQAARAAEIIRNPLADVTEKLREMNDLSTKLTKKQLWAAAQNFEKFVFEDVDGTEKTIDKAWTDEAREASAEARRRAQTGASASAHDSTANLTSAGASGGRSPEENRRVHDEEADHQASDPSRPKTPSLNTTHGLSSGKAFGLQEKLVAPFNPPNKVGPERYAVASLSGKHYVVHLPTNTSVDPNDKDYIAAASSGMTHDEASRFSVAAKNPVNEGGSYQQRQSAGTLPHQGEPGKHPLGPNVERGTAASQVHPKEEGQYVTIDGKSKYFPPEKTVSQVHPAGDSMEADQAAEANLSGKELEDYRALNSQQRNEYAAARNIGASHNDAVPGDRIQANKERIDSALAEKVRLQAERATRRHAPKQDFIGYGDNGEEIHGDSEGNIRETDGRSKEEIAKPINIDVNTGKPNKLLHVGSDRLKGRLDFLRGQKSLSPSAIEERDKIHTELVGRGNLPGYSVPEHGKGEQYNPPRGSRTKKMDSASLDLLRNAAGKLKKGKSS